MQTIITFLLFFSALLEYAEHTSILQFADYRLDRTKDYFFSRGGIKSFSKLHFFWKITALFLIFNPNFSENILQIIAIMLIVDIVYRLISFLRKSLPTFTFRSFLTLLLPTIVETIVFIFLLGSPLALVILLFRPFIFILTSIILWPFSVLLKNYYIKKATEKMRNYKRLKVVGITGSYGKTTVKVFLSQILEKKFNVIHTPKNINTEMGIAKFILQTDFSSYDIFVVEMGSYGKGEIKIMTKITKPTVGILTTIIEQHLVLFKTIKNIQHAKFELLHAIPKKGISIANIDNEYIKELLPKVRSKVRTFGANLENKPNCLIKKVIETEKGIEINFKINKENWKITSPILGKHQAYNLGASILAAVSFGVDKKNIIEACSKITVPDRTMKLMRYGKSIIIDDSYNSNPVGFKTALKTLEIFNNSYTKIVIAKGMFELGRKTKEKHKEVGEYMTKYADKIILTTKKPAHLFEAGINEKEVKMYYKLDKKKLTRYIKKLKQNKNVILLEHRLPEEVYKEILADKDIKKYT
ncbi:MAG: UDP-N-acetylmuramoyl-tripeptide--D-alanyl-D-alanine ligase [Candidatus Magasanikbacteria bacterium]|nr:UDP-N-acetylmuramoyl-tripeptide--D-alanyl-D-alanine ligase [Candidatus Magasanikbacteria bacterium]